jgi:nitrite reductase/ring-hydroxylating ferredoxin subunit
VIVSTESVTAPSRPTGRQRHDHVNNSVARYRTLAAHVAGLQEGESRAVVVDGTTVVLARSGGRLYAISPRCTHAGSRLDGGKIANGQIICPLHGARFDLASGRCVSRTRRYSPLAVYSVRECDGGVELALTD